MFASHNKSTRLLTKHIQVDQVTLSPATKRHLECLHPTANQLGSSRNQQNALTKLPKEKKKKKDFLIRSEKKKKKQERVYGKKIEEEKIGKNVSERTKYFY